jgi:hypothetical protein
MKNQVGRTSTFHQKVEIHCVKGIIIPINMTQRATSAALKMFPECNLTATLQASNNRQRNNFSSKS